MTKFDGKSLDIVSENVEKLKELFPEVFSEGKIDFTKLQEAKRIAQTPSTGTLRPSKEESKDWDTTQNLYIEGDNLELLKLLQKSYHKKVKMISIDSPYNTAKDFVYKDNFRDNIKNYMEQTGQIDKVLENTIGMYGSIKGIAGNAIGNVKALELPYSDMDEES